MLFAVHLKEVVGEEMAVLQTAVKAVVAVDRVKAEGRIGIMRPCLLQILMLNWTSTIRKQ
jgi:hypothetical protein